MYDVIIIGSGPAGLTAGIYISRSTNLKALIIGGSKWGGQLMLTTLVENYPGFTDGIQGPDLMLSMRKQAEKFGCGFIEEDFVSGDLSKRPFIIKTQNNEYQSRSVIIATGADNRWLDIKGEKEKIGRGVSSCAPCDAPFFKDKKVIVVGGGDSAMEEAMVVSKFASQVIIAHRGDSLRASKIMQDRVAGNPKITILFNTQLTEIVGENKVSGVKLTDNKTGKKSEMSVDGVFVAIGHMPNTAVFKDVALDKGGYVAKHEGYSTNIPGIFVAGDVHDQVYKQAVTAAGFGCSAAIEAQIWLSEN